MLKLPRYIRRSRMSHPARNVLGALLLFWAATGCDGEKPADHIASKPLPRDTRTVLSGAAAEAALNACSGSIPRDVSGLWIPDDKVLDDIDHQLPSRLDRALKQIVQRTDKEPEASGYYRQYIGLRYRRGRQTIHVNGFYRGHLDRLRRLERNAVQLEKDSLHWRTNAISSCDGGYWFFSAEYDPARARFVRFELNGGIGG
jgi:hypothetical protein